VSQAHATPERSAGGLLDWVLVALLALAFSPALLDIARTWGSVDYLSYGLAVPPLSLWLAWWSRPKLARLPSARDLRGGLALALAFAVYLAGFLAESLTIQAAAIVAAVSSCIWFLRGLAWLRALSFPLGYLVFVIPPPTLAIGALTTGLRLLVTAAALAILHQFELPVAREGNVILLPGEETLFVAEACSGISSIFTLIPAAVLLGRFTQPSWAGRVLLVLTVVPIALFWNLVRVLGTVLGSLALSVEQVAGPAHEGAGLVTFSLGCLTLLGVDSLYRRCANRPGPGR
jgi:exosortase